MQKQKRPELVKALRKRARRQVGKGVIPKDDAEGSYLDRITLAALLSYVHSLEECISDQTAKEEEEGGGNTDGQT